MTLFFGAQPLASDEQEILPEAEHADATRDDELPYQRRRQAGAQSVYGLGLPAERIEQLRRLAQARGLEPSVLPPNWVIEQLDRSETGDRDPSQERWERELRATTERLRELLDERPGA